MNDFYDEERGYDEGSNDATVLVNGSRQPLETGANFMNAVRSVALQAGFGKFRVLLNGTEVRPSSAPAEVEAGQRVEIRPFDEAG